jgi:hypothetical protein
MRRKRTNLLAASVVLLAAAPPLGVTLLGAAPEALEAAIDPGAARISYLAAGAAAIITGLLLLLYLYRRRAYILWWTAGWGSLAASLACDGGSAVATKLGLFLFGAAQLLALVSAMLFLAGANAYQLRLSLRRRYLWMALPFGLWFLLAPLALGPAAVRTPGHLLTAAVLAAAGGAHILILRSTGLLGAGVVGTMLLVQAVTNMWRALAPEGSAAQALGDAFTRK